MLADTLPSQACNGQSDPPKMISSGAQSRRLRAASKVSSKAAWLARETTHIGHGRKVFRTSHVTSTFGSENV